MKLTKWNSVLGFAVDRGLKAHCAQHILEWIEVLGEGAPIPRSVLVRAVESMMQSESAVIELLFDNGLVAIFVVEV